MRRRGKTRLLNGYSSSDDVHPTEADSGAIDHIAKPFTMEEVRGTVERMLALSAEDRDARRQMLTRAAAVYGAMTDLRGSVPESEDDTPGRRFGRLG